MWHRSALQHASKLWLLVRADGSVRWWGLRGSQTAAAGKQAGLAKHATCSARGEQPPKRFIKPHEQARVQWMLTLVVGPCALDIMSKRCDWFKDTSRSNFMVICTPTTSLPPQQLFRGFVLNLQNQLLSFILQTGCSFLLNRFYIPLFSKAILDVGKHIIPV